ncbi:hypothetical protein VTJ49DRAFT_6237 [Mycothermus thermophilus]|uniref:Tafazzin n=1 Tax=Humicola insolens TaxID=85995 RepID=A0ABR3VJC6_HUMIN
MPKKRRLNRYSKPQSTAPALLSSTATRRNDNNNDDASHGRSVNDLLAQLRRTGLNGAGQAPALGVQPTVPPELRQILNIPETPPPRPRRPLRPGPGGPRLPAGPAPPRSWLSAAERADHALQRSAVPSRGAAAAVDRNHRPLPGLNLPARRSLLDMVLRRFATDWEWQRAYNHYHLYEIPTHLRVALVAYLAAHHPAGVSLRDLRAILLPPPDVPEYLQDPDLSPAIVNATFTHLDLSSSLLRSLRLKELTDFLSPPQPSVPEVQDSWDAPDPTLSLPPSILPNLTHLSLALDPSVPGTALISWRHLLTLASHLSGTLTHLSLAFWPEPSLTPRARATVAGVVSPVTGRTVAYGGTGPYSHSLDGDWSEQVLVLRRLSRALYGLEWLDLTGCGAWWRALWESVPLVDALVDDITGAGREGDGPSATAVDWVGAWGKVTTLVMFPGYRLSEEAGAAERARYWEIVDHARRVERHVRACRAGKGRFLTVETCEREEE